MLQLMKWILGHSPLSRMLGFRTVPSSGFKAINPLSNLLPQVKIPFRPSSLLFSRTIIGSGQVRVRCIPTLLEEPTQILPEPVEPTMLVLELGMVVSLMVFSFVIMEQIHPKFGLTLLLVLLLLICLIGLLAR